MFSTFDTGNEDTAQSSLPGAAPEEEAAPRILVADDQKINRAIIVNILQDEGYSLETAKNGREVVDKWESGGFDLILMDIHMPLVDGIEATWIIRSHEENKDEYTPIIACSADYAKERPEEFSCLGFDGFVRKPLDFETLLREIRRCLHLKKPRPA